LRTNFSWKTVIGWLVLITLVASTVGYLIGGSYPINRVTQGQSQISYSTLTSTVTAIQVATQTVTSPVTVYGTSYKTSLTIENNSLSNLVVGKIQLPPYPMGIAADPITNKIFVVDWYQNTTLFVINGTADSIIAKIPLNTTVYSDPIVNPITGNVYVDNFVINGTTNRVSGKINSNITFSGVDESNNIVYGRLNVPTHVSNELYKINGSNNQIIDQQNYSAIFLGNMKVNPDTHMIYVPGCFYSTRCTSDAVIAINDTTLRIQQGIPVTNAILTLEIDRQSNLVYATVLENSLVVINGSDNQILRTIPITPFTNEMFGLAVDNSANLILVSGSPACVGFSYCGLSTLYLLSGTNYGLITTFVNNQSFVEHTTLSFDPSINETFISFEYSGFVLALKIPNYQIAAAPP